MRKGACRSEFIFPRSRGRYVMQRSVKAGKCSMQCMEPQLAYVHIWHRMLVPSCCMMRYTYIVPKRTPTGATQTWYLRKDIVYHPGHMVYGPYLVCTWHAM